MGGKYYLLPLVLVSYLILVTFLSLCEPQVTKKGHKRRTLVIGVYIEEVLEERRNLLRKTAFMLKGSCNRKNLEKHFKDDEATIKIREWERESHLRKNVTIGEDDCGIIFRFVMCIFKDKEKMRKEEEKFGDIVELNCTESAHKGKIFLMYEFMAKNYSWAEFVGKMDSDTVIYVDRVLDLVNAVHPKSTFLGHIIDNGKCGGGPQCPNGNLLFVFLVLLERSLFFQNMELY